MNWKLPVILGTVASLALLAGLWGLSKTMGQEERCEANPVARRDSPREIAIDLGGGLTIELVVISAGEFMMGSRDTAEEVARKAGEEILKQFTGGATRGLTREHPRHRVRITRDFYIGKYEVTQAQYEHVMGANPSHFKGDKNPVETVAWNDATEFCRRLSQKGRQVRLPTEAEWEYACRAGTTTPFYFGETLSTDQANFDGNYPYGGSAKGVYRQRTTPVGSFPPNAWGLCDMHGNVGEWCADLHARDYYSSSPVEDPTGPACEEVARTPRHKWAWLDRIVDRSGGWRVVRGGAWLCQSDCCRSAARGCLVGRNWGIGFRVVADAPHGR